MDPLRIRLAETVRELRKAAGYSQEAFAARIKVHRTFMSSIERGLTNVSLETLERIARGLDMRVWELIRVAEDMAIGTKERGRRAGTYGRTKGGWSSPLLKKIAEEINR